VACFERWREVYNPAHYNLCRTREIAMARKALIAGVVLVVILIVAVKFVGSNLDGLVQRLIEKKGSEVAGVPVSVNRVALELKEGRGEIGGLVVDNPNGYKERHAFNLGSIVLAIDPATVTSDVMLVRELTIDAPDVAYEEVSGTSNVEAIANNADSYARTHDGAASDTAPKGDPAASQRFIVDSLQIRNGKVRLPGAERGDGVVDLPTIRISDIGKSRGGVTGPDIAQIVIAKMTEQIKAVAKQALAGRAKERVTEAVKDKIPERQRPARRR